MTLPAPARTKSTKLRTLAPWTVFFILMGAAVVAFFKFAGHVPSLLQALADH